MQCYMIFNIHAKFLIAVDILTFKSLHLKNQQMDGCTIENLNLFFCNILGCHNLRLLRPVIITKASFKI